MSKAKSKDTTAAATKPQSPDAELILLAFITRSPWLRSMRRSRQTPTPIMFMRNG